MGSFLANLSQSSSVSVLTKHIPNNFTLIISLHLVHGSINNFLTLCIASEMLINKQSDAEFFWIH